MSKKTVAELVRGTVKEQLFKIIDAHVATHDAILVDYSYATEESMNTELTAANENLILAIDKAYDSFTFKEMLSELEQHENFEVSDVIDVLSGHELDHVRDRLISHISQDVLQAHFVSLGYACVKVNNLRDRNKIEEFLKSEIYPNYRDQQEFIAI